MNIYGIKDFAVLVSIIIIIVFLSLTFCNNDTIEVKSKEEYECVITVTYSLFNTKTYITEGDIQGDFRQGYIIRSDRTSINFIEKDTGIRYNICNVPIEIKRVPITKKQTT